jgi:hypothetical protein
LDRATVLQVRNPVNAFAELAEMQIVNPVKARRRTAHKLAQQNALQERDQLCRLWQKWHQERVDALLAGPCGDAARVLIRFLETITLEQGSELIALVRNAYWSEADSNTRFLILGLIDSRIAQLREQHGLAPFDDALPDEPPTVFQIVREVMA